MCVPFISDVDSRPWDFQAEECSLRCAVDRFNHRRYEKTSMSAAAATARAAAAAAAAGGVQEGGSNNRDIIVSVYHVNPKKLMLRDILIWVRSEKDLTINVCF